MKEENHISNDEELLKPENERLLKIDQKLSKVQEKFEETTLAMEMLKELKKSGQRKFILIIILIIALVSTNVGWLIYESQFETVLETEEQLIEDIDTPTNSNFTQTIN